jgi:unsaturated rhamnogalacturonyl hydrolase
MNKFKRVLLSVALLLPIIAYANDGKTLIIVTRNYTPRPASERVSIVVDYKSLVDKVPTAASGFTLKDGNFGKAVAYRLLDNNKDGVADQVVIDFAFTSEEPVYSFSVEAGKERLKVEAGSQERSERLAVVCLSPSTRWLKQNGTVSWPDKIIQSTMAFYPDPATLPLYAPGNYSYEYAFFLNAMLQYGRKVKNESYHAYVKTWADRYLDAQGKLDPQYYDPAQYQLDHLLPGRTFLSLYQIDNNEKYKTAADQLKSQLLTQPKTSDGGYWHKQIYPNQMWLDGIYMADIFATQYGAVFNKPHAFNDATKQINLIWDHTYDKSKGLMYHGWDESHNPVWAHPEKGTSPEFWSRAMGWYMMAVVECSDYLPADHPEREVIMDRFETLCNSVRNYQDKKTWLWYQVTDKGGQPGNWIETSGSAMFAYAFAKGERKGLLDKTHRAAAEEAFESLIEDYVYFDDEGKLYFDQTVKIGTLNIKNSKGDYNYYITTERRINDYKGLGALLYLSLEMD